MIPWVMGLPFFFASLIMGAIHNEMVTRVSPLYCTFNLDVLCVPTYTWNKRTNGPQKHDHADLRRGVRAQRGHPRGVNRRGRSTRPLAHAHAQERRRESCRGRVHGLADDSHAALHLGTHGPLHVRARSPQSRVNAHAAHSAEITTTISSFSSPTTDIISSVCDLVAAGIFAADPHTLRAVRARLPWLASTAQSGGGATLSITLTQRTHVHHSGMGIRTEDWKDEDELAPATKLDLEATSVETDRTKRDLQPL
jgi:hypothetical protein